MEQDESEWIYHETGSDACLFRQLHTHEDSNDAMIIFEQENDDFWFNGSSDDQSVEIDHRKKSAVRKFRIDKFWKNSKVNKQIIDKELKILNELKHPSIVQMVNFAIDPHDTFVICYEYVSRISLRNAIEELPYTFSNVLKWSTALFDGLNFLHQRHFAHRDIKPGNIFVKRNYEIKLGDFGSLKVLSDDPKVTNAVGTPSYQSPEALNSNLVDWAKNDIYSLGLVLWELVERRIIFETLSRPRNVEETIFTEDLCSSMSNWKNFGVKASDLLDLRKLIKGCTKTNPLSRYSAGEALSLAKVILNEFRNRNEINDSISLLQTLIAESQILKQEHGKRMFLGKLTKFFSSLLPDYFHGNTCRKPVKQIFQEKNYTEVETITSMLLVFIAIICLCCASNLFVTKVYHFENALLDALDELERAPKHSIDKIFEWQRDMALSPHIFDTFVRSQEHSIDIIRKWEELNKTENDRAPERERRGFVSREISRNTTSTSTTQKEKNEKLLGMMHFDQLLKQRQFSQRIFASRVKALAINLTSSIERIFYFIVFIYSFILIFLNFLPQTFGITNFSKFLLLILQYFNWSQLTSARDSSNGYNVKKKDFRFESESRGTQCNLEIENKAYRKEFEPNDPFI